MGFTLTYAFALRDFQAAALGFALGCSMCGVWIAVLRMRCRGGDRTKLLEPTTASSTAPRWTAGSVEL